MAATDAVRRVDAVIDALDYDFRLFEVDHFLKHLRERRSRPLHLFRYPLEPELFAFWLRQDEADFIFVNRTLHWVHTVHCLLHEIAHVVLGHRGQDISKAIDPAILQEFGIEIALGHFRRGRRSEMSDPGQEQEAELFVSAIQGRLNQVQRLSELYGNPTSIAELRPFVDALGFNS
ncbi:MAG: hypothetical protein L6Q98_21185 [Anaerolineae bacterium]|nr:hypothetical protein [Anaerolineae bacterium]NUQ06482.1 hypothetical protein [Anaerolineae bacterium]